MQFLLAFTILSLLTVIFSTVRSLITVKGDKGLAALISGAYFAFYNVMLIYTVMDFSIAVKCAITFVCNVVLFVFTLFVFLSTASMTLSEVKTVFEAAAYARPLPFCLRAFLL